MDASRKKVRVAALSVLSNGALVAGKIVVGTLTGSVSVLSEAIHSGIDLLASLIALIAVRTSGKPADPEHPWGHEKVENLSGAIEAILIFVAAIWIIYESVDKLLHPKPLDAIGLGVGIIADIMNLWEPALAALVVAASCIAGFCATLAAFERQESGERVLRKRPRNIVGHFAHFLVSSGAWGGIVLAYLMMLFAGAMAAGFYLLNPIEGGDLAL